MSPKQMPRAELHPRPCILGAAFAQHPLSGTKNTHPNSLLRKSIFSLPLPKEHLLPNPQKLADYFNPGARL